MIHDFTSQAPDASTERRPGNPMERDPEPVANAHWAYPEKQPPSKNVLKGVGRRELTATFGTAHPPRAVSGVLRRVAYGIPDYRARHWMLLILADRVDGLEARLASVAKHPATWLVLAGAASAWLGLRRRAPRPLLGWR